MLKFFKMQGLGNDYIFLDKIYVNRSLNYSLLSKRLSNRNFYVGSDGLIVLLSSQKADAKMLIFNSDGSSAKICGNALRCACFYLAKKYKKQIIKIELKNKIVTSKLLNYKNNSANVSVILNIKNKIKTKIITINKKPTKFYIVDVGNIHAVTFVDNFNFDVEQVGDFLNNKVFKNGINVEFVKILNNNNLFVKVYERGSKITKACGSGACATAYVYYFLNKTKNINVNFSTGKLKIIILNKNKIKMIGNCKYVFKGEIKI